MFAAFQQGSSRCRSWATWGFERRGADGIDRPAVLSIGAGEKPFPRMASITETGRDVLAGTNRLPVACARPNAGSAAFGSRRHVRRGVSVLPLTRAGIRL